MSGKEYFKIVREETCSIIQNGLQGAENIDIERLFGFMKYILEFSSSFVEIFVLVSNSVS